MIILNKAMKNYKYSKKELSNIHYDKIDYPSLDINVSLDIRENNSNDLFRR